MTGYPFPMTSSGRHAVRTAEGGEAGDRQERLNGQILAAPPPRERFDLTPRKRARRRHAVIPAEGRSNRAQRCHRDTNRTGDVRKNRLNKATERLPCQREQKRNEARVLRACDALAQALNPQLFGHDSFCRSSRTASHNDSCLLSFPLPRPNPRAAPQCRYGILCRRVSGCIVIKQTWFRQLKFCGAADHSRGIRT